MSEVQGRRTASISASVPRDVQLLWAWLAREPWRSLLFLPTDAHASAAEVTSGLDHRAYFYEIGSFRIINAEGVSVTDGAKLTEEVTAAVKAGIRTIVTASSLDTGLGAFPLVKAVEAVVLVVRLGQSELVSIQNTLELVGRERVLGCVTLGR